MLVLEWRSLCKGEDTVVVSIGTNDIPWRSVESVRRSFMELLFKLKDTGCKVLVVGLLPRRGRGSMVDKMLLINQWLESVCRLFEFGFVNFWLKFESRDDWFLRDGLHLTKEGARVLARGVNRAVKDFCSLN